MSGWAIFYLVCFVVGVTLSVLSFLGGSFHLPHVHVHVPHVNAHVQTGSVSAPHVTGGVHTQVIRTGGAEAHMPVFNFATITAFLAWFGGTGYLLTRYSTLMVSLIMLLAVIAGLVGASIIFWFVAKLLLKHDRELDPADYDRIGVLGRIISPDSRRRNRRDYLLAGRYASDLRRAQRSRRGTAARYRSHHYAIRGRHRLCSAMG